MKNFAFVDALGLDTAEAYRLLVGCVVPRPIAWITTVDAQGRIWWFDAPVATPQDLAARLAATAAVQPQPELHIRGDARADYLGIGQVVYAAQQAGIARIGFITEPPSE